MTYDTGDALVDKFLGELRAHEPENGYLWIEADAGAVSIDGWLTTADLGETLRRIIGEQA